MSDHLTAQELARYRARTLPAARLLAADDHLAACAACRGELQHAAPAGELFAALRADLRAAAEEEVEHLTYDQLAAHTDGASDAADAEIVTSHLAVCAPCRAEAADLLAFKRSLETDTRSLETDAPAPSVAAAPRATQATRPAGLFAAWRAWLTPARLASGAVALLLVFGLLFAARVFNQRNAAPQVAQVNTPTANTSATTGPTAPPQNAQPAPSAQPAQPVPVASPAVAAAPAAVQGARNANVRSADTARAPVAPQTARAARLEVPAELAALSAGASVLMGITDQDGPAFALTAPVGTFVRSARPTFRWAALAGAESYTVEVYDARLNRVAASPALAANEWTPAAPLAPGQAYAWQVTAHVGGREVRAPAPPAPEARFKILTQAQAAALARAERAADSPRARGLLYARAGLLDDAEREFAADQNSPPARRLLRATRRLRSSRQKAEARSQ
ncbi:MAG TPA: hypothetical protein VF546_11110 [Pyrinomonadaceae bacterium]|jgi:hypothetical protein